MLATVARMSDLFCSSRTQMGLFAGCANKNTAISLYHAPIPFGVGLCGLLKSTPTARDDFDLLYLIAHALIKGAVSEVDDAVRARVGVGVSLLAPYSARLLGVHSAPDVSVGRASGCPTTCGAFSMSGQFIPPLSNIVKYSTIQTRNRGCMICS